MTDNERDWIKEMNAANLDAIRELRDKVGRLEVNQAVTSARVSIYIGVVIAVVELLEHFVFHKA